MVDEVSDYLLSSLKSYFGEEKGEKLAKLLARTGIRCFDDLSMGIPDGLLELAEIDKASFIGFLEEYGPQAITKLKRDLMDLSYKMKQLESQLKWAREKLLSEVGVRSSDKARVTREIDLVSGLLGTLVEAIQLCYDPHERISEGKAITYAEMIDQAIGRLNNIIEEYRDLSNPLRSITDGLSRLKAILDERVPSCELTELLSYSLSALSDVKRLIRGGEFDNKGIIWENILLKTKIIALLCRKG